MPSNHLILRCPLPLQAGDGSSHQVAKVLVLQHQSFQWIFRVCPSSCPLNQWCHTTISPSVALFSFCVQFFPASESFPVSQLFTSDGESVGASASASVLPKCTQVWFLLRLTIHTLSEFTGFKRNPWEFEVPMNFQRSNSGINFIYYLVYMCILFKSSVLIPRIYPKEDMLYESL